MAKDLSIIIPFVGEYPSILFTIQSTAQSLMGSSIDFEIIAVNNYCEEVLVQAQKSLVTSYGNNVNKKGDDLTVDNLCTFHKESMTTYEDRSGPAVKACAKINPWLKYVEYNEKLSHWQAKRVGVENSEGRILLFMDAHVVPSYNAIIGMYDAYNVVRGSGDSPLVDLPPYDPLTKWGTLHLPLTYKILESHKLIYKLKIENKYFYSYSFTTFKDNEIPYEVPCMSTCGMMISREIYDAIGGWPKGLGIYGGGENFMNYTLAVCGYKKLIYPQGTLFHHGDKRDYHYIYDDHVRNRMIAHYLFGGKDLLMKYKSIVKGRPKVLDKLASEALSEHLGQREKIKAIQRYEIEDWIKPWMEEKS